MIDALSAHYGIEASAVTSVSDNVVRAQTAGGDLAIKTFTAVELERAARESALLAHLRDGIGPYRVPVLVETRDGEAMARVGDGAIVVMQWCGGAKKMYTSIALPEWFALGNALAALHARLDDLSFVLPRASPIDLGIEYTAMIASRERALEKDPERGGAIARYLDARLAFLDACGERGLRPAPGVELPIHNDYNQHNYLFDGALPPVIIDWEAAILSLREYEVVRCLNHLPIVAPPHATAFLEGYRDRRPLDRERLRWAVDRALLEHAVKSWPVERWLADLPGADASLSGSMEVFGALSTHTAQLEAFFGVDEP